MTNNFYPSNDARLNEARRLLNELSVDDMQKLINNNGEMDRFIEKIPEVSLFRSMFDIQPSDFIQVQQLESIRENMREKNRRLAERNLEKKPMLDLEKQKLVELHTQLAQLKEQYKRMRGQQGMSQSRFVLHTKFACISDDQNGEMTPDVIYTLLQSAATDLERSSEVHDLLLLR